MFAVLVFLSLLAGAIGVYLFIDTARIVDTNGRFIAMAVAPLVSFLAAIMARIAQAERHHREIVPQQTRAVEEPEGSVEPCARCGMRLDSDWTLCPYCGASAE